MRTITLLLTFFVAFPALAYKKSIFCENKATGAEAKFLGRNDHHLATFDLNPALASHLRAQGVENAHSAGGIVGDVRWNDEVQFEATSAWGENLYLRKEKEGTRLVLISLQYKAVAEFLFNPGECEIVEP